MAEHNESRQGPVFRRQLLEELHRALESGLTAEAILARLEEILPVMEAEARRRALAS